MKRIENIRVVRVTILLIALMLLLSGGVFAQSKDPAKRYAREHSDKNFWAVMRSNTSFTLPSLKDDLKSAKATKRANRKKSKAEDKKKDMLARIEKIKGN